jgi:hypothetical protein
VFSRPDFDGAVADVQDLLRGTCPPGGQPGDGQARLTSLRERITQSAGGPGQPAARHQPRRPWWPGRAQRRLVLGGLALPALLAATAAGWAIAAAPPASALPSQVICYSTAYPGHRNAVLDYENSTGQSPVALCAGPWRATGHRPKSLVACVLPASRNPEKVAVGRVGVFPDTSCVLLGLPVLPPGYERAARRFARLLGGLAEQPQDCLSRVALTSRARQALAGTGLRGWRITTPGGLRPEPNQPPGGCWWATGDSPAHAVQILPKFGVVSARAAQAWNVAMAALWTPPARCRAGQPQQSATAEAARVRAALRRAGLGYFTVVNGSPGAAARPVRAGHGARGSATPCFSVSFGPVSNLLRLQPTNEAYGGPHQAVTAPPTLAP